MLMLCIHLYKLIWSKEKTVKFYVVNIYRGCIFLYLEMSIAASYLLFIMYFSVISHGHSLMMCGSSDKNNTYIMETVSTLTPINSNLHTRISLLSAVNARILAAMNTSGNLQQRSLFLMDRAQIHKFIYTNKYCRDISTT